MYSSNPSNMTVVNRKVSGTLRENSLYYFMCDHLRQEPLLGLQVRISQGEREALYVSIPVTKQLNTVFLGFELKQQHLSVDRRIINESSPLSRHFYPSHCTFEYEREHERCVVHAYFNRNGQVNDFQLKTYVVEQGNRGRTEGRQRLLTHHEKCMIRENIPPFQDLLRRLLDKKAETYVELYKKSFQMDTEIAEAICSKHLEQAMRKTAELQALTHKLTQYNDAETDGRTLYLTRLLERLSEAKPSGSDSLSITRPEDRSSEKPADNVSLGQPEVPQSVIEKKIKQTSQQQLMEKINQMGDEVIAFCNDRPEVHLCLNLIEIERSLESLNDLFLELELNDALNSIEVRDFVCEQRAKLPINKNLRDYFNERVLAGDLESVSFLFPIIAGRVNMGNLSFELIQAIQNSSDPQRCAELIKIADFFYEQSECYRAIIVLKSQMIDYYGGGKGKTIAIGLLFDLFKKNNILAFEMALRHGVLPDSLQFMTEKTWFYALQTMNYDQNPNIHFIKTLMKYGAQITFHKNNAQELSYKLVKTIFKQSNVNLPKNIAKEALDDNGHSDNKPLIEALSNIQHGLTLARRTRARAEVQIELAKHESTEVLLLEGSTLVSRQEFNSRFLPKSAGSSNAVFQSKEQCDQFSRTLLTLNAQGYCFLFYIKGALTGENSALFTCANDFLMKAKTSYALLLIDEQRRIMSALTEQAKKHKALKKYPDALYCFNAAQIAYTMMAFPSAFDHQAMLQIFAFKASVKKMMESLSGASNNQAMVQMFDIQSEVTNKTSISNSAIPYLDAYHFLINLPPSALKTLEETPIYLFINNKIAQSGFVDYTPVGRSLVS